MKLYRFADFLVESVGQGINFTGTCAVTAMYSLSSNNLHVNDISATPGSFSVDGGSVHINDAAPWLLKVNTSILQGVKREQLKRIKISSINEQLSKKLEIEDGKWATVGELLKANPDLTVNIKLAATYNYRDSKFGSHVRGTFKESDVVMEEVSGIADYSDIFVQGISADEKQESLIEELSPALTASKRFVEFYEQFFNDYGKYDFISDELRAKVDAGQLDDELASFISDISGYEDYTIDQLKAHINDNPGTLNDFAGYISDKEANKEIEKAWKDSLINEYTADYDPQII